MDNKIKIQERPLGRDSIKLLAMAAMLCNHCAHIFPPQDRILSILLQIGGWFTAPVMCWFLCEGWEHTSSRKRYLLRMLLMAAVAQPFYTLAFGPGCLDMLFTLSACLVLFYVLERIKDPVLAVIAIILAALATFAMDWPFMAVMMAAVFYYGRIWSVPAWAQFLAAYAGYVGLSCLLGLEYFGLGPVSPFLAGLPILAAGWAIGLLYNGQRSRGPKAAWKWFFYGFYPAHLAVLVLLSRILTA